VGEVALLWLFMSGVLVACAVAALLVLGAGLVTVWLLGRALGLVWAGLGVVVRDVGRTRVSGRLRSLRRGEQAGGVRRVLATSAVAVTVGALERAAGGERARPRSGAGGGVAVVPPQSPDGLIDKPSNARLAFKSSTDDRRHGEYR
jgi:hypothetical protein